MSFRKSGVLFSAASREDNNDDSNSQNDDVQGPSFGMMSAVHNEYSDMEEDDDDDDNDNDIGYNDTGKMALSNPFKRQSSFSPNFPGANNTQRHENQNSMVSQYGIGAKLLMGMGYQEGKGLGSRQNGIAVPIETKLRPQGLGVGGIRENTAKRDEIASSDDELPVTGIVTFSKPTYDLFAVIDSLEKAGVRVPTHYKELSDSASTAQNPLELEKVHTKLSQISSAVALIDVKIRNLNLEIGHIDRTLESDKLEKSTLEALVGKLNLAPNDIGGISVLLEELTKPPFSSIPDIQKIFVAYAKPHVTSLFSSIDEQALDILLQWAVLYRNLESGHVSVALNPWDSLIVQLLQRDLDLPRDSEYNVRFWLDSPVVINSPLVEHFCLEEIVMPALMKTVGNWDLLQGFERKIIEDLADFDWDNSQRRQIVEAVANKYEAHLTRCWKELREPENFWKYYQMNLRPVLDHFSLTGVELIGQYHEKKAIELKQLLVSSLLTFCQEKMVDYDGDKTLAFILEFHYSFDIISPVQLEILMLFTVLNPMVKLLVGKLLESESPLFLFYHWQELFKLLSQEYPEVEQMLIWYTNVFIETMRSFRDGEMAGYKLPAYNQDEFPVQALENLVLGGESGPSVYSVAARDLLVTFRDVVQQECLNRNVMFQATGRRDNTMNELFALHFPDGASYECFVSNDVLWVLGAQGFSAVDLLEFLDKQGLSV